MLHYHQTKNILTDARQQMKKPCWNWIYNSILCSKFSNWGQGQINEQIQEFIIDRTLEMNTMEYTQWKKMCQEFEGSENGGMVENNSRKREKEKAI